MKSATAPQPSDQSWWLPLPGESSAAHQARFYATVREKDAEREGGQVFVSFASFEPDDPALARRWKTRRSA